MCAVQNIAVFGGTFDPPHLGHKTCLEYILKEFSFEKIIVLPAGIPHFKTASVSAKPSDRLEMTKLAFGNMRNIIIEDYESQKTNVSYTVETIQYLQSKYPDSKFTFVMSSDVVFTFANWYKVDNLLKLTDFIVFSRSGHNLEDAKEYIRLHFKDYYRKFAFYDFNIIDLSSTDIRNLFAAKIPSQVKDMLEPCVFEYILTTQLYI
ncbi:MAG: nicotinate (nicotinamide) nucleotide adenylyltransferase [Coriobacteriales bacterium]|nr:nicotinate (nicotinamide) nucleotide adenylyltransferase [Coriobacteriales bacterium]